MENCLSLLKLFPKSDRILVSPCLLYMESHWMKEKMSASTKNTSSLESYIELQWLFLKFFLPVVVYMVLTLCTIYTRGIFPNIPAIHTRAIFLTSAIYWMIFPNIRAIYTKNIFMCHPHWGNLSNLFCHLHQCHFPNPMWFLHQLVLGHLLGSLWNATHHIKSAIHILHDFHLGEHQSLDVTNNTLSQHLHQIIYMYPSRRIEEIHNHLGKYAPEAIWECILSHLVHLYTQSLA